MAKRTDRQGNSTDSQSPLYNTLRIRFINCLVGESTEILTNQDGKSQSLSCHNVLHL